MISSMFNLQLIGRCTILTYKQTVQMSCTGIGLVRIDYAQNINFESVAEIRLIMNWCINRQIGTF